VTYTNGAACTPDLASPERFRCGTAGYVRFEVDYDETNGILSSLGATRGTPVDSVAAGLVTWTPASAAGTAGIIGPNGETATLSFDYTLGGSVAGGTLISFPTRSYWSNSSPGDPTAVAQTVLTCNAGVTATVPPLTLIKSGTFNDESTDGVAQPGETIAYTFQVTNTGSQTLTSVTVSDPMVAPVTCPGGNPIPSLAPAASLTCTGTYALTQADVDAGAKTNTATAMGMDPGGAAVSTTGANSVLLVPGGPPVPAIPMLSEAGKLLVALVLAALALASLRGRLAP